MKKNFGSRDEYHKLLGGQILDKKNCPFCGDTLDKDTLLWEGNYWRIFINKFPYTGDNRHIMALPKEHKKFFYEITPQEFAEMIEVHKFVKKYFGDDDYFSFTRETFGLGTRSVEHLHMHFMAGVLKGKFIRKMLEKQGFPITQDLDNNN